ASASARGGGNAESLGYDAGRSRTSNIVERGRRKASGAPRIRETAPHSEDVGMRPELNHIWSCRDIDRLLDSGLRGPTILPEQARRHLENCARCRELHAFMTSGPQTRKPSPEVLRQICAALNSDLQPVSPLPRERVIAGRILGAGGLIVLAVSLMKGAGG